MATRICKICGKEYEYCHTNRGSDIFRWQDVACSPEHGSEYFAQIIASRAEKTEPQKTVRTRAAKRVVETQKVTTVAEGNVEQSDDK